MSYINKKFKIRKLYKDINQTKENISIVDNKIISIKNLANYIQYNFNKNKYRYDSDWSHLIKPTLKYALYSSWQVDFDNFPKKFLSYLNFKVIFKTPDNTQIIGEPITNSAIILNEEINNKIYNITLLVSFQVSYASIVPSVQSKLLIGITNPSQF